MAKQTAYDRAIAAVQERTGKEWGAASWLADQIGVSRQAFNVFRKQGKFPEKHLDKICKATGLPRAALAPEMGPEIIRLSRKWRCSVKEAEERIMRAGLAQFTK